MTGVDSNPFKLAVKATDLCPELCEVPAARRSESLQGLLVKHLTRLRPVSVLSHHSVPMYSRSLWLDLE